MTGRKPGKGGFDLSDDDRRVWRDVTSDYEKLHSSALLPEAVPLPPSPGNREKKEERPQPVLRKNLPPLLPGAGDAKAFKPVRKSARAIEAVLDLHGHTESAAHAALLPHWLGALFIQA
ncbi:MAG: hypothetical protein J0L97_11275, partial [Alphaproteobacteria bacterium]|nr:hypothetical protein [Alphaproteobacteria bacterium]